MNRDSFLGTLRWHTDAEGKGWWEIDTGEESYPCEHFWAGLNGRKVHVVIEYDKDE
jgi:hypothetical protein